MQHLLNALYSLTLLEQERGLTNEENEFYLYCYDTLTSYNIEIPFAVEI